MQSEITEVDWLKGQVNVLEARLSEAQEIICSLVAILGQVTDELHTEIDLLRGQVSKFGV